MFYEEIQIIIPELSLLLLLICSTALMQMQVQVLVHCVMAAIALLFCHNKGNPESQINPTALRTAKTLWRFGHSECSRVKLK